MELKYSLFLVCVLKFMDRNEAHIKLRAQCTDQIKGRYKVTPITTERYSGGESPVYVKHLDSLFWVDFTVSSINRLDLRTNKTYSGFIDNFLTTFIIPVADKPNFYLCGTGESVAMICWDGYSENVSSITNLYQFPNEAYEMLDDGDVSRDGSVFIVDSTPQSGVNTSDRRPTPIYSIGEKKPKLLFTAHGFPNGLRFDPTGHYIYSANSDTQDITQYRFYAQTTSVGSPKPIFKYKWCDLNNGPDSFTLDVKGNLWVATETGGTVLVVNPKTRSVIGVVTIGVPDLRVSNCIFGGEDYKTLFVTTRYRTNESVPGAGYVYRVDFTGVDVQGFPRHLINASTIVPDGIQLPECPCSKQ